MDDAGARAILRQKPISDMIRDASETPPEVSKFDLAVFTANVNAQGGLVQSVPLVRVPSDYDFSAYGIRGWAESYATLGADAARVTFNLRESGRNMDIFQMTDQQFAAFVTPTGPANDFIFPERQLLRAGSELQARFSFAAGWANGARLLGFVVFGQLIAKGIGKRG